MEGVVWGGGGGAGFLTVSIRIRKERKCQRTNGRDFPQIEKALIAKWGGVAAFFCVLYSIHIATCTEGRSCILLRPTCYSI